MNNQVALIVDDEPSICWAFEKMLTDQGHIVFTASSAEEGLRLANEHRPDLVVLDVRLPGEDGLTALPKFLQATDNSPVIVVTAFGDLQTAVAAVNQGATEYLTKPFRLEDAERVCRQALQQSRQATAPSATAAIRLDSTEIVGTSPAIQQVFRQIALVSDSDLSVLITGETGTGKELVAAAIHRHSRRSEATYLPIAPVALNPDLIESELFGHVRGAFTGASEDREGVFGRAESGTVLLDEIGDLPLNVQVKLLRVLEHGEYFRVGDVRPRKANVRVIAATNCDLYAHVAAGKFREDLFHRLSGVQIHLPPLRERTEDIDALCKCFLAAMNYPSIETAIDDDLLDALRRRPWQGNVRELSSAVQHAAVLARGRTLRIDDFPPPKPGRERDSASSSTNLKQAVQAWSLVTISDQPSDGTPLHARFLAETEPTLISAVLKHTSGNRAKAAELLGIHRGTLRQRLREYGLDDSES